MRVQLLCLPQPVECIVVPLLPNGANGKHGGYTGPRVGRLVFFPDIKQ
jgi:hypothetical protein